MKTISVDKKIPIVVILFFALYPILPEYFGIEIASSFPIISGSRIILILLFLFYIFVKGWKTSIAISRNKEINQTLLIYFLCVCMCDLFYLIITKEAIKDLFVIFLEQLCLIWIITKVINNIFRLEKCLHILVYVSGIIGVCAIIESFGEINVFYYLNTVSRDMLMSGYRRMGMLRAEAGFGHAVYYGAYCVLMLPLCMYFIENKKRHIIDITCFFLNIVGLFLSNSRGSLVAFIAIILIMLCTKKQKEIMRYQKIIVFTIIIGTVFIIFIPNLREFILGIIQSLWNIISGGTNQIANYGTNAAGMESRMIQFSAIPWVFSKNPIFGLGAKAHTRGVLSYFSAGKWRVTNTIDIGYIGIISNYGALGIIGFGVLFFRLIKLSVSRKYAWYSGLQKMFKYVFYAYLLCLLTINTLDNVIWPIIGLFIAYINIIDKEKLIKENHENNK